MNWRIRFLMSRTGYLTVSKRVCPFMFVVVVACETESRWPWNSSQNYGCQIFKPILAGLIRQSLSKSLDIKHYWFLLWHLGENLVQLVQPHNYFHFLDHQNYLLKGIRQVFMKLRNSEISVSALCIHRGCVTKISERLHLC